MLLMLNRLRSKKDIFSIPEEEGGDDEWDKEEDENGHTKKDNKRHTGRHKGRPKRNAVSDVTDNLKRKSCRSVMKVRATVIH